MTDVKAPVRVAAENKAVGSRVWLIRILIVGAIVGLIAAIFNLETKEGVGVAIILLMLVLIFCKIPVGVALSVPGMIGLYSLYGTPALENILRKVPFTTVASWEYSVIPMFIFMGLLLWHSGITGAVYDVAKRGLGWMPGGLGIGTNLAGAGLAATSGSTIGILYAIGRIAMPEMLRAGYDKRLASGTILMAGLIGQVIPPSIFLVIYAGIAQVPVGPQLIAGIGPGLLMAIVFALTILIIALVRPSWTGGAKRQDRGAVVAQSEPAAAAAPSSSWKEVIPLVLLIVVVVGGIYQGLFTATEAGAAGALGALIIVILRHRNPKKITREVKDSAIETIAATGGIFFLLIGSLILARVLAVSGLGVAFSDWVTAADLSRWGFLVIIIIVYLILGMFMDSLSILILTVPLLMPLVLGYGISPLWFGVFVVILAEMAMVTPPVGVLAFIFHDLTKSKEVNTGVDIKLGDVFTGIGLFMPAVLVVCGVLIAFPEVSTFLTDRM